MEAVEALRAALPPAAKDVKLNFGALFTGQVLEKPRLWGTVLSCAFFLRSPRLKEALLRDAGAEGIAEEVLDDARAAAAIMAMNTVYYRFRHMVAKPTYSERPARLRMTRMARPATSKGDFELFCLACAALAGCEACLKAHEVSVLQQGLSEEQVHEAVRVAAVLSSVATALEL